MNQRQYSAQLLEHFDNSRHVGTFDLQDPSVYTGQVETNTQDEVIQFQLKVDNRGIIKDIAWQALGNPVIIASCSLFSELVLNKSLDEAQQLTADELAEKLAVPAIRWNSVLLVEEALQKAIQAVGEFHVRRASRYKSAG